MNSKTHQYHFRPIHLRWYFIVVVMACLSLLSLVQAQPFVPANAHNNIQQFGTTRIIVTLEMPKPEGLAQAATAEPRMQIEQLQWQFLHDLYQDPNGPNPEREVIHQYRTIPAIAFEVGSMTLSKIQAHPLVGNVEEDQLAWPILLESIPLIKADNVWALGYSGVNQAVAVLDTGVDKMHPDLAGKVIKEACFSSNSSAHSATTLCPNESEEQEGDGAGVACNSSIAGCSHGTHVAGIVAANGPSLEGVAKGADIIAIQVFSRFDNSTICGSSKPCALSYTSDQIAGLEKILELQESGFSIAAVNMSLGSGKHSEVCTGIMQSIIDNLREAGIATVAASGNEGYINGIASPACISSAISVGATTKPSIVEDVVVKPEVVANYSNSADILDLLAPGSFIQSTLPGGSTGIKSGTSMATPHVAGAFAVLKSAVPTATVDDILGALKQTGEPIEDSRNGIIKPRINLEKALKRLLPDEPPPVAPNISVTPTSHDFGNVEVGQSSNIAVTISNTGDGDLNIGQLALTDGDFISSDDCSNTTVIANGNCTITITFNPQIKGAKNATLSIPSNDSDTPTVTVTLSGNGILAVVLEPNILVDPMFYDFGDVKVDESSNITVTISSISNTEHDFGDVKVDNPSSVTVTISNIGHADLEIGQISLSNSKDFSISNDNCSNTTVKADANCTVTTTFNPLSEGVKKAMLSIPSNDPDTNIVTVTLTGNGIVDVVIPSPASCQLYVVHDQGRNNSQIFTISLDPAHEVNPLGPMYLGYDLEAIAIQPTSNIIYVASGEDVANGQKKGAIYTVDSTNGDLSLVCNTGINEIEDLAFSADGETLWAWAKGDGLITIDLTTITTDPITGEPTCDTDLVIPSNAQVEGLTLKEDNGTIIFYGAVNTSLELWEYNSSTSDLDICSLPSETEALEIMSDGTLLFGTHNDSSFSVHAFDPDTCDELEAQDIPTGKYNDVEGIALPVEVCAR